jgi:hypothetical protein
LRARRRARPAAVAIGGGCDVAQTAARLEAGRRARARPPAGEHDRGGRSRRARGRRSGQRGEVPRARAGRCGEALACSRWSTRRARTRRAGELGRRAIRIVRSRAWPRGCVEQEPTATPAEGRISSATLRSTTRSADRDSSTELYALAQRATARVMQSWRGKLVNVLQKMRRELRSIGIGSRR